MDSEETPSASLPPLEGSVGREALLRLFSHLGHEVHNPLNVLSNSLEPLGEYFDALSSMLRSYQSVERFLPDAGVGTQREWSSLDLDYVMADAADAVRDMEAAVLRIRAIHEDLTAYVREHRYRPTHLALATANLARTYALLRSGSHGVSVRVEHRRGPKVRADERALDQAVANLVRNALDATGEVGSVLVSTGESDGWARIEVHDSGLGVAEAAETRIFEPFFGTKDLGTGAGLGLTVARRIVVEGHGGRIGWQKSGVLEGACFFIELKPARGRVRKGETNLDR